MSVETASAVSGEVAPAPLPSLDSLSSADLATWRQTGAFPSANADTADDASTPKADSSPAAPDAQAAATAASKAPASEPGTPKKANAETRKTELQSEVDEIKALLKERHDLRRQLLESESPASARPAARDAQPAASSPATQPQTLDAILTSPDPTSPLLNDTEFYTRYPEATLTDFARYVTRHELAADRIASERQTAFRARGEAFKKTLDAAIAADATFWPTVEATAKVLVPLDHLDAGQAPRPLNFAAQEVLESPHGPAILAHLAANPADLDALKRCPDPRSAIKTIARLEERLSKPSVPSTPVVKTTSSAPPPPVTLGTKTSMPADDAEAALKAGDFPRYRAIVNRREMTGA